MYGQGVKGLIVSFVLLVTFTSATAQVNPRLTRQIRSELVTLPFYGVFDWLYFELTPEGAVTLRGQVVRPSTRSDAERRVRDLEGVTNVTNQIETLPLSPSDDRLRRAVYRQIYGFNSPLFRYGTQAIPSIHIIINRGHATLRGVVSSRGDAQIAYMRARTVPGLFSVTNELTVESEQAR